MVNAENILNEARKYLGVKTGSAVHHAIVDTYNAHQPLAQGYKVRYIDNWCDTFVSYIMIKLGATALTGTECGVQRHVSIFSKLGIWIEDGNITPRPGDIIVYNWDGTTQPNDGFADHIGFVETVSGRNITTIEGNKGVPGTVARRSIVVGAGFIRGYARPKYSGSGENVPDTMTKKVEVTGYWDIATTRELQRLYKTPVDGIVSSQWNWGNPGLTTGWEFVRNPKGSQLIDKMQGGGDGLTGPNTIKGWQRKAGTPVDGQISKQSLLVMYIQRCINAGKKPF